MRNDVNLRTKFRCSYTENTRNESVCMYTENTWNESVRILRICRTDLHILRIRGMHEKSNISENSKPKSKMF
jgi:hypothetical protein